MRKWIGALLALTLLTGLLFTTAVAAGQALFGPDEKLSKGYTASLTYQFIRDKVPGGAETLARCSGDNPYSDIDGESAFKQKAIACLNEWGYFDRVKGHDRAGAPSLTKDTSQTTTSTPKTMTSTPETVEPTPETVEPVAGGGSQ